MNKNFKLKVGERTFNLCFNIICTEQLGKILKCELTPQAIMQGLIELNNKSSFLMYKAIIYCGILGYDYMTSFEESVTSDEVGKLISDLDTNQLSELFNTLSKEMGYDLKAEPEKEQSKKKVKKT